MNVSTSPSHTFRRSVLDVHTSLPSRAKSQVPTHTSQCRRHSPFHSLPCSQGFSKLILCSLQRKSPEGEGQLCRLFRLLYYVRYGRSIRNWIGFNCFELKLENEYIAIAFPRCHQNLKSANHIVVVLQSTAARKYKVQHNYFSIHQIIL